jgi:hypothetical protein
VGQKFRDPRGMLVLPGVVAILDIHLALEKTCMAMRRAFWLCHVIKMRLRLNAVIWKCPFAICTFLDRKPVELVPAQLRQRR